MRGSRKSRRWAALLLVIVLAAGCASLEGEDESPIPTSDPASSLLDLASPTPEVLASPSPTPIGWLAELVASDATSELPGQLFFLDGPEVSLLNGDLAVEQITDGARARFVASAPDGSRAAVVFRGDTGGREVEEIRLLDPAEEAGEPVFGPEIVSGPASNPRITGLYWSPDGARLAVSREDGSIWIVAVDGSSEPRRIVDTGEILDAAWAPSGAAIAVLAREGESRAGRIEITNVDGPESAVIEPAYSYGAMEWLRGTGRLAVAEESSGRSSPLAGSIFAVEPASSGRELLVSAGEFAPRAAVPMLSGSPDGRWLAFPVLAPGPGGELRFLSLWLLELESGLLRQVGVPGGYRITDLWWTSAGLVWRGVQGGDSPVYAGVEPFVIGLFDLEAGGSRVIYESIGP